MKNWLPIIAFIGAVCLALGIYSVFIQRPSVVQPSHMCIMNTLTLEYRCRIKM